MRLKEKVVVVSGAGSGIGRQIAIEAAEEGAHVLALDVHHEGLAATTARAEGIEGAVVDVTNAKAVNEIIQNTVRQFGHIDGLVHSAYWTNPKPLLETSTTDFDRTLDVVVKGAFFLGRAVIPVMLANQGGVIIPIASVHSVLGFSNFFAYQIAKAGLLGYVRSIAVDYGPSVRSVALAPGAIDTPALSDTAADVRESLVEKSLAKRIGTAHDVARAAVYLLSDESSFMTGTLLLLDGGWSAI